jgi:hypothetical protein
VDKFEYVVLTFLSGVILLVVFVVMPSCELHEQTIARIRMGQTTTMPAEAR